MQHFSPVSYSQCAEIFAHQIDLLTKSSWRASQDQYKLQDALASLECCPLLVPDSFTKYLSLVKIVIIKGNLCIWTLCPNLLGMTYAFIHVGFLTTALIKNDLEIKAKGLIHFYIPISIVGFFFTGVWYPFCCDLCLIFVSCW